MASKMGLMAGMAGRTTPATIPISTMGTKTRATATAKAVTVMVKATKFQIASI